MTYHVKYILILFPVILLLAVSCQKIGIKESGVRDRRDLTPEVSHLKGNVYLVEDSNYWKTNSVFYSSKDGIAIFDSGWTEAGGSRIAWKATVFGRGEFLGLFLTDDRPFRTGGTVHFEKYGMPIYTTKPIFQSLRSNWGRYQQEMKSDFGSWLEIQSVDLSNVRDIPDNLLDDRIRLIRVSPAFSPGNFLVFFTAEKVLYGGSLLSVPLYFRERIQADAYKDILNIIKELNPEIIISGHGTPVHDSDFPVVFFREIQSHFPDFNLQ